MSALNVGIIGFGVGERHADGYASCPGVTVAAVADFAEAARAKARGKLPGARIVADANEVLDDPAIHAVSIASWDNHHADQVVRALEKGKHVFVEKPLCLTREEALRIRHALDARKDLVFSSNLILRKSPRFQWVRDAIRAGKLGRLYYLEGDYQYGRLEKLTQGWRGEIPFYSVFAGGAVHLLDLALWMQPGDEPVEVSAMGNSISTRDSRFRHRDFVSAMVKFQSGLIGKFTANFGCVLPHYHGYSAFGTKATFLNGLPHGLWFDSRDAAIPPMPVDAAYPGVTKGGLVPEFVKAIRNERNEAVTPDEVFRSMVVCFAVEESLKSNGPVPVTPI